MGKMRIVELFSMPQHCVYAFVCHESKRFMVGYTKHLLTAISRISHDLETPKYKQFKMDINSMELEILEKDIKHLLEGKVKVSWHTNQYKDKGYKQYYPIHLVKYKVGTGVHVLGNDVYHTVYLKDGSKNRNIVGLFKSEKEMQEFIDTSYPDTNNIYNIVFANNSYTTKYLK
jgi:hypothetical protein